MCAQIPRHKMARQAIHTDMGNGPYKGKIESKTKKGKLWIEHTLRISETNPKVKIPILREQKI